MNKIKNTLSGIRYESPELTVVELQLENAVLAGSDGSNDWTTTGGGGISDLVDNGDEL